MSDRPPTAGGTLANDLASVAKNAAAKLRLGLQSNERMG
jgi:hypothetical protein